MSSINLHGTDRDILAALDQFDHPHTARAIHRRATGAASDWQNTAQLLDQLAVNGLVTRAATGYRPNRSRFYQITEQGHAALRA